ncbi:hypothetical protein PR048_030801 [Dryococelus australis]|uniref:Uncharacterized protein n=1 Tax=Dryococelus australis TaxID=614101 RepID=A0ABQ9G9X6_9NEOP|nr:hypothetical protein PR048_030801 [Dryococelus australis]
MAFVRDPSQHSPGVISGKPWGTEIRTAGPGFEPGSSRVTTAPFRSVDGYGVAPECKSGGNGSSARKAADQRRLKERGKREIPEKIRRPTASSGTIPTCENPVTRPGIEPGSPWWKAGRLTAQPPWPQ